MITKGQIEQVINRAESEFVDCWTFLAGMKDGKLQQNSRISIHQFQPKLAASLFDLSRSYREIEQEKNRRITKKALYSASWFAARMQFLASQQQILNKAIAIGRGIGDAFVWFFYHQDVMISTVFNPAHFFAALEKIGFVIEELGALSYKVFRKQGNMQLELSGLSHYFAMIQHYLFPEEAITSLLANAVGEIANSTADPPQRIELLIEQKFGRPPV